MKNLLTILLSLIFSLALAGEGETYFIIQLKGGIVNKTTGKPLKMGDKIGHNDQLKFMSTDAAAVLMSTKRGRFIVKPGESKSNSSELTAFVKNVLLPVKSSGNLSTRGGEADGIIDLKSHLGNDKFAIIGDQVTMRLNAGKYPLSDSKFFIYRYEADGRVVSKKIPHEGEKIILDKKLLYVTQEGDTIPANKVEKVDIYSYDATTKSSALVTKFSPMFLDKKEVMQELKVQYNVFKTLKLPKDQIEKELLAYIRDIYGKTDEDALNEIIQGFYK